MWVSISFLDGAVMAMELERLADGRLQATDRMLNVVAGEQLGRTCYDALRRLTEGEHEIPGDFRVTRAPDAPEGWGGFLFLALLFFAMAPVALYWVRGLHEHHGRVRVHWLIGLAYGVGDRLGIGGDWAVAGLMALFGIFFLAISLRQMFRGKPE